jgi:hypothetical protein
MALSNIRKAMLGGGIELICGTYTHTAAATSETIEVDGEVVALTVNPQNSANSQHDASPNGYSVSLSGAIRTVTFLQNAGISAGTFALWIRKGGS